MLLIPGLFAFWEIYMAWTQADVDALKAALKSGVLRVRYSDGREVEYNNVDQMLRLLQAMEGDVLAANPGSKPRYSVTTFSKA